MATVSLTAVNRRGREITCRVSVTPLSSVSISCEGAVVVMEELSEGSFAAAR